MRCCRRAIPAALFALVLSSTFVSTSCLARRRLITRKGGDVKKALATANKDDLLARITTTHRAIQNFNATVDMVPVLGSADKGKITEYKDVRAYILFDKPKNIRIIGLYPVVRNKAFDMVSNGVDFKLYIPAKNRFVVGANELIEPSPNKLENLRPQHFLDALLIEPPVPDRETALLENLTDEETAEYILHMVRKLPDASLELARDILFERVNLQISRQLIFDNSGNILTDARYTDWQVYDGVPFPRQIEINRPKDEYGVVITMVKVDINKGLTADKFVLDQPEGTQLQVVGRPPESKPTAAPADGRDTRRDREK